MEPTAFEWAALRELAVRNGLPMPPDVCAVRVLSREHTGVGSFVQIKVPGVSAIAGVRGVFPVTLDAEVAGTTGAALVLFHEEDDVLCLEIAGYGDAPFPDVVESFSIPGEGPSTDPPA